MSGYSKKFGKGFFITPKKPLLMISEKVGGTNKAFCIAVYSAIRCAANDIAVERGAKELANGPVEINVNDVAGRAGCSYNKAAEILNVLQQIGVIQVQRQVIPGTKCKGPSVFTFPALEETSPTIRGTPSPQSEAGAAPIYKKEHQQYKENKSEGVWALRQRQDAVREEMRRIEAEGFAYRSSDQCQPGEYPGNYWKPEFEGRFKNAKARLRELEQKIAAIDDPERAVA